ncbi:MAG: deoxyribonuclease V [Phycisphaerae bacterium]|nr:deoxyribonuclease V [Phycisphaerae bacterium]
MIHHRWDISPAEAIALQKELAGQVREESLRGEIKTVAGVDCAFTADGRIVAVAVLCNAKTMAVLATAVEVQPCGFPYISGLLSFREAPAVIAAVKKLHPAPDLLMCDGQGIAHPRGLGLASHVGLWLNVPTIGVAKSRLCGQHRMPGAKRGAKAQLRYQDKTIGAVLRTRDNVRPLYISVGHRITLPECVNWVLRAGEGFRLPEPTRQADQRVTRAKKGV